MYANLRQQYKKLCGLLFKIFISSLLQLCHGDLICIPTKANKKTEKKNCVMFENYSETAAFFS
jgi:hypothetical protein